MVYIVLRNEPVVIINIIFSLNVALSIMLKLKFITVTFFLRQENSNM